MNLGMSIITSVNEVSTIMAEIASAGGEQATGLDEVNGAVSRRDIVTQQNAAMAEENTVAARSMLEETNRLVELLSFFKNAEQKTATPIISPVSAPRASSPPPVGLVAAPAGSPAVSGVEWDEF